IAFNSSLLQYRTYSTNCWVQHLKRKHATTPIQAGYSLRCDCGHESHSQDHSYKCEISNYTVICDDEQVIRRLTDQMAAKVVQGFTSSKVRQTSI
ncbi:hypothetical protein PMAYCL1PPCAC_01458, partial [Pristionchus mayeri]